jgi:site-specific DNA recombinase
MRPRPLGASHADRADQRTIAVGYVRCSNVELQDNSQSLQIQRDQIEAYARAEKFTLLRIYEDAALSGSAVENRPALLRCLENAKTEHFTVLVSKLDRIARNSFYTLWIEKELRRVGASLYSISEPYRWEDPGQKIFLTVISAFAEFEAGRIADRLRAGRMKAYSQNRYPGGKIAYGMSSDGVGRLIPNETEAAVVRQIFKWRYSRMSFQRIADRLNQESITTRTGKRWNGSMIRYMIANPIYRGSLRGFGEIKRGTHEAIIR